LFSATITEEVKRLAYQWCTKPISVSIEPEQVAVETVDQKVYLVTSEEKYPILYNLIKQHQNSRMAVFANQKIEAKKLHERLRRNGINCTLLTGDIPQDKRTKRLENFRSGQTQVLVATDVAGRGIHIEGISHVINYTLPYEPEDYVHRIGRTGRAGAEGISVSFACEEESFVIPEIEKCIGRKLECIVPDEELLTPPPKGSVGKKPAQKKRRSRPRNRPRNTPGRNKVENDPKGQG
jgi:ATP-dependent RNA helicase RhlB